MALPSKLKNFNAFIGGVSYAGIVTELELPKLMRNMEDYRAGGMNGPVKADQGMQGMEMGITAGGHVRDLFREFGAASASAVLLRFAGAYQQDDTATLQSVEIVARGRYEEIDPGTAKAGEGGATKAKLAMSYYKLSVDGNVDVEIDLLNMVEIVAGVDRLAEQRKAIGL